MTEHTAGPWQVETRDNFDDVVDTYLVITGRDIGDDSDRDRDIACIDNPDMVAQANARLIAAAPIGYELAEAVLAWAREPRNHGGNPYLMQHVKLAEAFITAVKARSQQEVTS